MSADTNSDTVGVGGLDPGFRRLRFADEVIYLRSGSLNIFNAMVGLNFFL